MIAASLSPKHYTSQIFFEEEQKNIFKKLWLFAGLEQQFENENDFITRDFSGIPVLIQRIDGELHAFRNACAHRGAPLQTEPHGNRKLICKYHGWSYKKNGVLRGIPNESLYNICSSGREKISLEKFSLAKIGSFIFLNLSSDPLPIKEQIPEDIIIILNDFSKYFSKYFSYTKFTGNYNWKLNFENILDWNHVSFLHKDTFSQLLPHEKNGAFSAVSNDSLIFKSEKKIKNYSENNKSSFCFPLKEISRIFRVKMLYKPRWFSELFEDHIDRGAFLSCQIFPNMNFGSVHGETFFIQQYVPIAADKLEYHSWILTAKFKTDIPPQPQLLWGIHHAEKKVVDEDIHIFEAHQKALSSAISPGVMGDHEAPLAEFGMWYLQNVKETQTCDLS